MESNPADVFVGRMIVIEYLLSELLFRSIAANPDRKRLAEVQRRHLDRRLRYRLEVPGVTATGGDPLAVQKAALDHLDHILKQSEALIAEMD